MRDSQEIQIVDGVTFELRTLHRTPSNPEWVCLRKNRQVVNRYLDLASDFQNGNLVEVGVDQGGGTSFLAKLFKPRALLAVDLAPKPVATLDAFIRNHRLEDKVEVHWGVDQSDRDALPQLVDAAFAGQSLDLVVDDASHLLAPTTATFEMLFPRVRPGGRFIIEDWSAAHIWDRVIAEQIRDNPAGETARTMQDLAGGTTEVETPMSLLICQLIIASSRAPGWVSEVTVFDGYCEVTRGPEDISENTPIAEYIGELGNWLFAGKMPDHRQGRQ